jgi:hypothetical protein
VTVTTDISVVAASIERGGLSGLEMLFPEKELGAWPSSPETKTAAKVSPAFGTA